MKCFLRLLLLTALFIPAAEANAQTWPARPIKLVVPTGAGTATDVMARLVADGVSRTIGQPMVVENMPGASGILGHQAVARALADGYTILFTNTSGLGINLVSFKKLPYNPEGDFAPVAMICNFAPQMLSVNSELPVKSVPELIAYDKANRGKLAMGFDSTAGAGAFAAKLLNKRADLSMVEVPYRAAAQMVQDVAGGTTQVMMSSIAVARPVVDAGKVRRIAVTSGTRFPGLPDLPSISEAVPGLVMNGWFAVVAPAATPKEIVQKLNLQIGEYLKGADIQKRLLEFGLATEGAGTPESAAQIIQKDQADWRTFAKELNVEPQ